MRGLFVIPQLPWPTMDGTSVTVHHLRAALRDRGHQIHLLLLTRPTAAQLAAWPLRDQARWSCIEDVSDDPSIVPDRPVGPLHHRWLGYWDLNPADARRIAAVAAQIQADYVEAFGQSILPLLNCIRREIPLLWIAHDDRCLYHLSRLRTQRGLPAMIGALRNAAAMAAYERTYRRTVDVVSAVASPDEKMLRLVGGFGRVELIPLGMELPAMDRIQTTVACPQKSAAFWGRLDYAPNIDAVRHFAAEIWPELYRRNPGAVWRVIGRQAGAEIVEAIAGRPGIELVGGVADLTEAVCRSSVAIVPMRSGNGVKMKLLEAAAIARPIVTSPMGAAGAMADQIRPWLTARGRAEWIDRIERLWNDPQAAAELGRAARLWVAQRHTWAGCAAQHQRIIDRLIDRSGRPFALHSSQGGIAA